jgi:hypothetical protein
MPDTIMRPGLRGFLDKGGFWRLVVVVITYLALYEGSGLVTSRIWPDEPEGDLLGSVSAFFFEVTIGLIIGALLLIAFVAYTGWGKEIFGRQPVYRSWWMWIAPIVIALPILFRLLGLDWGGRPVQLVLVVMATGLLIGFVEELLYRGIAVKMLRSGGAREWSVAALSSLLFAASHSVNIFGGQDVPTVAGTLVYTFAFGVLMYLTMRATGFIVFAMILHGLTDPTTILVSGGIDKSAPAISGNEGLLLYAALATFLVYACGYLLLIFIRGKVGETKHHSSPKGHDDHVTDAPAMRGRTS